MAVAGWVLDKSAAGSVGNPGVGRARRTARLTVHLSGGELEQLYSARSGKDYDTLKAELLSVDAPPDLLAQALELQQALADHHGMWHRTPIPDLLIAETALHHGLGLVHVDGDFDRIAEVRPLTVRRLKE